MDVSFSRWFVIVLALLGANLPFLNERLFAFVPLKGRVAAGGKPLWLRLIEVLAMYFVVDDRSSERLVTHVMRTRYHAVGTDHLLDLLGRAGFTSAERLDGRFYQPVLVGNREP